MNALLVAIVSGLSVGTLYVVFALGLTLIIGVMRVLNFAHGYLVLIGSYITYFLFADYGVDPLLSLFVVLPISFVLGIVLYYLFVNPVLKRPFLEENTMLLTFGGFLIFENLFVYFWTDDLRSVGSSYIRSTVIGATPWGDFELSQAAVLGVIIAAASVVFLFLFLGRTRIGRAMRAASQDLTTAQLMGVKVQRVYAISFGVSSAFAGIAGVVVAMQFLFNPEFGFDYLLKAFGVILMGGMGNVAGTVVGGLTLGTAESLTAYVNGGQFGIWTTGVVYAVILIALGMRASRGTAR